MKSLLSYITALVAGSVIFIGLPLLGWGLGSIPQFFANSARTGYVLVILALQIFSLFYNPHVGRYQEQRKSGVAQHKLDLFLVQIFSLAVVILAPFSDGHSFLALNIGDDFRYFGIILCIPGFVLMQMAEKYLGRQFSIEVTLQENHKLIQGGPYKFIRHPRYLGILLFFLGISLAFRSLLTILIVLVLCGVLVWRVFAEEALMKQEFGNEWDSYCATSWRILPFIF